MYTVVVEFNAQKGQRRVPCPHHIHFNECGATATLHDRTSWFVLHVCERMALKWLLSAKTMLVAFVQIVHLQAILKQRYGGYNATHAVNRPRC